MSADTSRPASSPLEDTSPLPDVAPHTDVPGSSLDSWKTHDHELNLPQETPLSNAIETGNSELRVLVIESDVENADRAIEILEGSGYRVEIATDATYGLMLAETFQPNLILLGTISERMTGADFSRMLQKAPGFMGRAHMTPILYLLDNRHLLQQRFHNLREVSLTEAIFKPINAAELLEKTARLIAQHADQ